MSPRLSLKEIKAITHAAITAFALGEITKDQYLGLARMLAEDSIGLDKEEQGELLKWVTDLR